MLFRVVDLSRRRDPRPSSVYEKTFAKIKLVNLDFAKKFLDFAPPLEKNLSRACGDSTLTLCARQFGLHNNSTEIFTRYKDLSVWEIIDFLPCFNFYFSYRN